MAYRPIVAGGKSSNNPLVLLHGVMMSKETMAGLVDPLAKDRQVIVPDLLGHGENIADVSRLTVPVLAKDIEAQLDGLGIGSFDILAFSFGGLVAQDLTLARPERVGKLVLVGTYAHKGLTMREKLVGALGPGFIQLFGLQGVAWFLASRFSGVRLHPDSMRSLQALILANDKRYAMEILRSAYSFDSRKRLSDIKAPTLVITGSQDVMVPPHHARMLAKRIPGARLNVVEGAGHGLFGTHLREVTSSARTFLEQPLPIGRLQRKTG